MIHGQAPPTETRLSLYIRACSPQETNLSRTFPFQSLGGGCCGFCQAVLLCNGATLSSSIFGAYPSLSHFITIIVVIIFINNTRGSFPCSIPHHEWQFYCLPSCKVVPLIIKKSLTAKHRSSIHPVNIFGSPTMIQASTSTPQHSITYTSCSNNLPAASRTHPGKASTGGSLFDRFCGVFSQGKKPSSEPEKPRHGLVRAPADKGLPPTLLVAGDPREGGREYYFGRVFRYFDEDGDGKISPSELRSCMRTVGEELSEEDAEAVVGSTDSDGDGLLGFEDFVRLVEVEGEEERTRDLREAFGMYAAEGPAGQQQEELEGGDGNHWITPKSLRRMLARLGEWKSVEECRVMIRRFDLNGDGVLSFDEFRVMML